MNPFIFSQLPNDLIMNIIQKTKTSLDYEREHKDYMADVTWAIENVGDKVEENIYWDHLHSDQFFCELFHNDELTDTIVNHRRNK